MHQSFAPSPFLGNVGIITSYSPACVSLGGGVSTHFHFFIAWFSDGLKWTGGRSEGTTSSHLKIRLTLLLRGWAGDSHLICQWSHFRVFEHLTLSYLRSSCLRFLKNALQGLVRGFKKGCHSRFYTGDFGFYIWVPRGWDFKWLVHKGFQLAPFELKTHQGSVFIWHSTSSFLCSFNIPDKLFFVRRQDQEVWVE